MSEFTDALAEITMLQAENKALQEGSDYVRREYKKVVVAGQAVVHAQKQRDDASDGLQWYKALRLFNRAMANLAALLKGDEK